MGAWAFFEMLVIRGIEAAALLALFGWATTEAIKLVLRSRDVWCAYWMFFPKYDEVRRLPVGTHYRFVVETFPDEDGEPTPAAAATPEQQP